MHADRPALGSFRMTSRACKSVADPVFYRQVVLSDTKDDGSKRRKFQEFVGGQVDFLTQARRTSIVHETIELILNPHNEIASFVQDLTIGPFVNGRCLIEETVLQKLLLRMSHLRILRSVLIVS